MVMDLNLPDLSGYELLETMAGQDDASFPPVIVYTAAASVARRRTALYRFSKSIIIKDALARTSARRSDAVPPLGGVGAPMTASTLGRARSRNDVRGRRILVVEDDARNIFALSGARAEGAGRDRPTAAALEALTRAGQPGAPRSTWC